MSLASWILEDDDGHSCTLSGTISSHRFCLIGISGYNTNKDNASWPDADLTPSGFPALANTGGDEVRLKDSSGKVIDKIGYGSGAEDYESDPTSIPSEGKSLQRKVNGTITENGYGPAWDSDDNSADFFIQDSPNPQNSGADPLPPIPELPTLILFSTGLLALAGYVLLTKRRK